MYEFDEARWDQQHAEIGDVKGITDGWLIQRIPHDSEVRSTSAEPHFQHELYLQIGTGQWCAADYATLFSLRSSAIVYAKEFRYVIGNTVRIVKHRY